jgi:hypothetical protein
MAKNTNYVVNVSSSEFKTLLQVQELALVEMLSIKKLMELSKDHEKTKQISSGNVDAHEIQDKILGTLEDQLKVTKRREKSQSDWEREWRAESANIAEVAKLMNTQGNVFEQMRDSFKGGVGKTKENLGIKNGGLGRTVMGALNVGGIFNKAIEKSKFKEKQRLLGGDTSDANAEKAYQTSKKIKAHDAEIEQFKAKTGLTHEQLSSTKAGNDLLTRRNELTDDFSATDKATHVFDPTIRGREVTPEGSKTAADSMQTQETQMELSKAEEQQTDLLTKIEENTRDGKKAVEKVKPEKASGGEGLMDMITGLLGEGLMKSLKVMFNPKNILKALGKAFVIGAVVGALFEGIMDGFDEFMKSGDIGKALVAGLAGIVDFLTFGLFDKDAIKEVIGDTAGWINDHIIKPYVDFMVGMKDGLMAALSAIGIPKIKLFDSKLTGEVSVGPFYPFKSDGGSKSPEAPAPTSASTVDQKSADNAGAALPEKQSTGSNIVNAPVNNNTTQNQIIRAPIRNQDSSVNRYADSRLRQA